MKNFIDFNLDIGWVLQKTNSKRREEHDRQIYKQCLGIAYCINNSCPLFGKEQRPPYTDELTSTMECIQCKAIMKWEKYEIKVKFYFNYE
jgi:hypothetical protein